MDFSLGTILVAFFGGIFMFLAPCTLPLLPALFATVSIREKNAQIYRQNFIQRTTLRMIFFSIGFTCIFVLLGVLTGILGSTLSTYRTFFSQISGLFIIVFGCSLLGIFQFNFSFMQSRMRRVFALKNNSFFTPVLLGVFFALGWSPCAGPILASILLLATQSVSVYESAFLLLVFSLGLTIPFILLGFFYAHTLSFFKIYERFQKGIAKASGIFLLIIGALLLFGQSSWMIGWGFSLYEFFGYVPACTYF